MTTFEMTDEQLRGVLQREAEYARQRGDQKAAQRIDETLRNSGGVGRQPSTERQSMIRR